MHVQPWLCRTLVCACLILLTGSHSFAQGSPVHQQLYRCNSPSGILCAQQRDNPGGWYYVGHDEPAVLFFSNEAHTTSRLVRGKAFLRLKERDAASQGVR